MQRGTHRRTTVLSAVIAVLVAVVFAGFAEQADARRLSGGKSIGRQSQNVAPAAPRSPQDAPGAQKSATPAQPGPAASPGAAGQPGNAAAPNAAARPGAPAAAQAAAAPARSRWMAPLAGLAAGLGLAALANALGFGEELASLMLMLLLAVAAIVVVRMVMSRRTRVTRQPALAGAGYTPTVMGPEASVQGYRPMAEPSYRPAPVVMAPGESTVVSTVAQGWKVPDGFDTDGFVRNARSHFIRLQASFDAGDLTDLQEFTSPEMFERLKHEIEQRSGGTPDRTDVVTLQADLLGVETTPTDYVASVRYSGMLREVAGDVAAPFDEVWNLTKPVDGSGGWVLAGIQQLAGRPETAQAEF